MVLISVVLPVFNGEGTVRETIQCVLDQTLQDLELIVVNDGSTDRTAELLDQIQDPRVKVFSFKNAGLSASRNRGLALANGDYISFIDADDLWAPQKLASQAALMEQSDQTAVVYSWTDFINGAGEFLHAGTHARSSGNLYKQLFIANFLESGSNVMIRREALVAVGGFDESLTAAEDWDCFLKLARHHSFAVVPEVHVFYRQPAASMSSNFLRQEKECLRVINRALQATPEQLQPLRPLSLSNLYLYLVTKALQFPLTRAKGRAALRFLAIAISTQPALLHQRRKLLTILGLKTVCGLTWPKAYPWLQKSLR